MKRLCAFLMLFCCLAFAEPRLSLKTFADRLQKPEEISLAFKSLSAGAESDPQKLKNALSANQKASEELQNAFLHAKSFVRGEIEDEKTLTHLLSYTQLSILKAHQAATEQQAANVRKELEPWFTFAADFPYEEASLIGLRVSSVMRSFLLDEIERLQAKNFDFLASDTSFRQWFQSIRAPWPVDRVVISESKKLMGEKSMKVVDRLAQSLQKNPYQTSAKVLGPRSGVGEKETQFLKQIWRDTDIELMKTEITRIGRLQLAFADKAFELKNKKKPSSIQDLINEGLIDRAPLNYHTGKALTLQR